MRALYIYTHGYPEADGHSTASRLSWLQLTLLARRAKVDLLALLPLSQSRAKPSPALTALCRTLTPIPLLPSRGAGVRAVLSGLPLARPPALALKRNALAAEFLASSLRSGLYDLIVTHSIYGLVNLPPALLRRPEAPPVCLVNEEVQWTAWRGYRPWQIRSIGPQQALQALLWPLMQRYERARYRLAREVLCLSERERQAVLALDPALPVDLAPLPFGDTEKFAPPEKPPATHTLLYTGFFGHPPNRLAAVELATRILPRVRREIPSARLCLAGRGAASLGRLAGPHVELVDAVPCLSPFYASAAVVAGPVRTGEGVRGKFLEALACGCPVVTTALGASGIAVSEDQGLVVCETPEAFAGACARLLRYPALRARLGRAAAETVRRAHSPAAFAAAFHAGLDRALAAGGGA